MKKYVKMDESTRKAFLEFCEMTKNHEADKDEFLKAARLERHESKQEPMKAKDIKKIICTVGVLGVAAAVAVISLLSGDNGLITMMAMFFGLIGVIGVSAI